MTAQQLKDKYEADLKKLQDNCTHEKTTQMEYHFAPGHFSGTMVDVCDFCWKTIRTIQPNQNIIFPKSERNENPDDEIKFC